MAAFDDEPVGPVQRRNVFASLPNTERGRPVLLGGDPKGKNFLYCCGNSVIIRDIANPMIADIYSDHQHKPTVARYAPSGFYIASGDEMGKVRIWDTVKKDHKLKIEVRPISGKILDLDWSPDSRRIVCVGQGRDKHGAAFFADSGASVGDITGHSSAINSCSMKQTRPFRVMTGGDDNAMCWFNGPPFRWQKTIKKHTRFVNCIRFSPTGDLVISAGQDKKIFVFDGKTGDFKSEAADGSHKAGVYAVSWASDGKEFLSASGDRTCKIFDVETMTPKTTFQFPTAGVEYQQLGCLWQGDFLLSLSLNGHLTYLDPRSGKAARTVYGHKNFITALGYDKPTDSFVSASFDAVVTRWNSTTGETSQFEGQGHTNQVNEISIRGNKIWTCSTDDSYMQSTTDGKFGQSIGTDSPAKAVASTSDGSRAVGVSMKSITVLQPGSEKKSTPVDWDPAAVAISPDDSTVAIGGADKVVHLYSLDGMTLTEKNTLKGHQREITALAFSPDGKYLASACKNRVIEVWDTTDWSRKVPGRWCFHGSTINSLEWSPDSKHLASASLDQDIFIWDITAVAKRIRHRLAHRGGVNVITWLDNDTVATAGQDCTIKVWDIDYSKR